MTQPPHVSAQKRAREEAESRQSTSSTPPHLQPPKKKEETRTITFKDSTGKIVSKEIPVSQSLQEAIREHNISTEGRTVSVTARIDPKTGQLSPTGKIQTIKVTPTEQKELIRAGIEQAQYRDMTTTYQPSSYQGQVTAMLLEKQKKPYDVTKTGTVEFTEGGRKYILSGRGTAEVSPTSTVRPEFFLSKQEYEYKKKDKAYKDFFEKVEYPYGRQFQKTSVSGTKMSYMKPETGFQKFRRQVEFRLEERQKTSEDVLRYAEQERRGGRYNPKVWLGQTAAGVTYVGTRALKGFVTPYLRPKETALGFVELVKHPVKTTGALVGEFYYNPVGTTAEFAGGMVAFKVAYSAGKTALRPIAKLSPSYVPYKKTGVYVQPGTTIPTPLKTLRWFETKTVPVVHATIGKLKPGMKIVPASWEKITGWRRSIGQRGFYTSSPIEQTLTRLNIGRYSELPQKPIWKTASYKGTPLVQRFKPVFYGGYVGIGEAYSAGSQVQFSWWPKTPKGFIFRETYISPTPKYVSRLPVRELVKWQSVRAGTRVAAENIKKMSIEGQFISSTGVEGEPLLKIVSRPGELEGKFTYYKLKQPVPEVLGGETAHTTIKKSWDLLTSREKKIKFYEVEFKTIKEEVSGLGGGEYISTRGMGKIYSPKKITASESLSELGVSYPKYFKSYSLKSSPSISVSSSLSSISSSSISKSLSKSSPSMSYSSGSYSSISSSPSKSYSYSSSISSSLSSYGSSISSSLSSSGSSYSSSISRVPTPTSPPLIPPPYINDEFGSYIPSFDVFLKRGGQFKPIALGLPKGLALKAGATEAYRTLGATFKLKPSGMTNIKDIPFFPSPKQFRQYKIEKGRKVITPLQFIERRGQRLSSRTEISEIQFFRKTKRRRF